MKILAIGGKNLASLAGEFRIDFRTEPLRSAGLFAITGSTGSGKSTILDAMCIALYLKTPRLVSIKDSEAIEINGKEAISESDPKTILSKGAHEGYAEVEFLAVDGNEYRARWSISRANDSASGRFRKPSYDVFNLTEGTHRNYGSSEYKAVMPSLIGLTYDEFTRAVLLAQGNFTAFLKAGEKEKAGILQKLTGTEIYNRISSIIYTRAMEARRELDIVDAQRSGIVLLTQEEKDVHVARKAALEKQDEGNSAMLRRLAAEKQWIERSAQLAEELKAAQEAHEAAQQGICQNRPVAERLERIDSVQEIRGTWLQLAESGRLCEENRTLLAGLRAKVKAAEEELGAAARQAETAEHGYKEIQAEYDGFKPRIDSIIKAEEAIASCMRRIKEINGGIARASEEDSRLAGEIAASSGSIGRNLREREDIAQWLAASSRFESIIPSIPVITANIQFIDDTRKQIALQQKALANIRKTLASSEKEHEELKKRQQELAGTLSSEIAELRSRLVEGEPCPVCGSRVHDTGLASGKTLAEEELEKAKEITAGSIEQVTRRIESQKSEAARLESMIETLSTSAGSIREKNIALLGGIEDSGTIADDMEWAARLQELAAEWEKKVSRLAGIKEEISVAEKSIELSTARREALAKEIEESKAQATAAEATVKECREQLTALLGKWKSREEAERHFQDGIARANRAFSLAAEKKAEAAALFNRLKGNAEEKEGLLHVQELRRKELSGEIASYLAGRSDGMSMAGLKELLDPKNDVAAMRSSVEKVKETALKAAATLSERKRNIEKHGNDSSRPREGTAIEEICSAILQAEQLRSSIAEEINGINATLLKDQENIAAFGQYQEIFEQKRKAAASWGELNAAFGSANGSKLTRLTQGYTLDILLEVANMHMKEFSGRYILSRISEESLGIKVIDLEMMSDSRSVHTLSGGETFLASLALSLALSSVSSNKMDIETLFIDEGFGALDSDTLKEAIGVLEKLQGKGRKIGVISHLGDMLERIPTRIKVIKRGNGKSKIMIG